MKTRVAGGLRLDLAAFRELEAFAQLGTELDKATQPQLDRGYRMVELLKQPQYQPMNVDRPGHDHLRRHTGALDKVPVKQGAGLGGAVPAVHARAEAGSAGRCWRRRRS